MTQISKSTRESLLFQLANYKKMATLIDKRRSVISIVCIILNFLMLILSPFFTGKSNTFLILEKLGFNTYLYNQLHVYNLSYWTKSSKNAPICCYVICIADIPNSPHDDTSFPRVSKNSKDMKLNPFL